MDPHDKQLLNDLADQFEVTTAEGEVFGKAPDTPPAPSNQNPPNAEPANTETPKTETPAPVATPPATTASSEAPAPSVNVLREIFGDDVDVETAKARYSQIVSDNQRLSQQAQQVTPVSEQVAKFDAFIKKTSIDDYELMRKVSSMEDSSDPIETILMAKRLSHGGKWTPQIETAYRNQLLKTYSQDESQFSEEEIALGKFELQEEAKKSWTTISDIKKAIDDAKTTVQPSVNYEQVKSEVAPIFQNFFKTSGLNRVEVALDGGNKFKIGEDEVEIPIVFDIPQDQLDFYQQQVINTAVQNGIRGLDAQTENNIKDYVRMMAIGQNANEVIRKAVQVAIEKASEVYDRSIHNPSALNRGESRGIQPDTRSEEEKSADEAYELLMKNLPS